MREKFFKYGLEQNSNGNSFFNFEMVKLALVVHSATVLYFLLFHLLLDLFSDLAIPVVISHLLEIIGSGCQATVLGPTGMEDKKGRDAIL